jgi:hypothetical protein
MGQSPWTRAQRHGFVGKSRSLAGVGLSALLALGCVGSIHRAVYHRGTEPPAVVLLSPEASSTPQAPATASVIAPLSEGSPVRPAVPVAEAPVSETSRVDAADSLASFSSEAFECTDVDAFSLDAPD